MLSAAEKKGSSALVWGSLGPWFLVSPRLRRSLVSAIVNVWRAFTRILTNDLRSTVGQGAKFQILFLQTLDRYFFTVVFLSLLVTFPLVWSVFEDLAIRTSQVQWQGKSSHASTPPTTSVILFEWGRNCTKTSCYCQPRFAGENSWPFHVELLLYSLLYAARFSRWIWPLLSSSLYGKERF